MPVGQTLQKLIGWAVRAVGLLIRGLMGAARGGAVAGWWTLRNVHHLRHHAGTGSAGMIRLLDMHAASCAGDTLVTIGLASTIFFAAPVGEARGRVALYLAITMVPFALLAPIIGPVLDRWRHGRRYAIAVTMLGRAILAWLLADHISEVWLYPAAFGVLTLSRAYGVARSAAVPRLLPPQLGLSEAGARSSVFGAAAGAVAVPIGAIAFSIGPQWPLRVASVVFLAGLVTALSLPPRADSDPPETVPKILHLPWRHQGADGSRLLSGQLLVTVLTASAVMRALYGFLVLFLAFAIRAGSLPHTLVGRDIGESAAIGVIGAAFATGTFAALAVGARLPIRRPATVQAAGLVLVAALGTIATLHLSLATATLLCLGTAVVSGLAKLCVDAVIQERVEEPVRASAFAHAETLLMLAWVAGGAVGLLPFSAPVGVAVATVTVALAAARAVLLGWRLRTVVSAGRASESAGAPQRDVPGPRRGTPPAQLANPAGPAPSANSASPATPAPPATPATPATISPAAGADLADDEPPPGFHIFRPSGQHGPGPDLGPDLGMGPRPGPGPGPGDHGAE